MCLIQVRNIIKRKYERKRMNDRLIQYKNSSEISRIYFHIFYFQDITEHFSALRLRHWTENVLLTIKHRQFEFACSLNAWKVKDWLEKQPSTNIYGLHWV